jgi:hypothetical protein
MKPIQRSVAVLTGFLLASAGNSRAEEQRERNWHVTGNISYSSRSLGGSIVDERDLNGGAFGSLIATGDSMKVGRSDSAMLALAAEYKRFGIGLNYMPTSFEGQGSALVVGSGANAGAYIKTPLDTNINVDMLLANVFYNFIQTPTSVFGLGLGFGQTSVDINMIPEVGTPIIYNGKTPFGFLNMHMANTYKRFLYGFALNGISMNMNGESITYSDYKVDVGYRLIDKVVKCDIVGGYRMVNFALDLNGAASEVTTDITLEGPFLGVTLTY